MCTILLTLRYCLFERESVLLSSSTLLASAFWLYMVGTVSFFNIARLKNAVLGIVMKGLSKPSALKCYEQRRDVSVGDHFARFVRTNAIQTLRLFFSGSKSNTLGRFRNI